MKKTSTVILIWTAALLWLAGCGAQDLNGLWRVQTYVPSVNFPECTDSFLAQSQSFDVYMTETDQAGSSELAQDPTGRYFSGEWDGNTLMAGLADSSFEMTIQGANPPDGCVDTIQLSGVFDTRRGGGSLVGSDCDGYCQWSGNFQLQLDSHGEK